MRKTIVTALVTLLVMLAVSCDSFITEPGAEKAEYTEDGRKLLTLNVKIGGTVGSRALTLDLAKEEANFMEVIFTDGKKFYSAKGKLKTTLKVRLPGGTYDENNSILLIGKKTGDDYTLLAIGTSDSFNLNADNQTILFDVNVLKADLYAGVTNPSFKITTTSFTNGDFDGKTKNGTYSDEESKCFQVPTDEDIDAELAISGFGKAEIDLNIALVKTSTVKPSVTFTPSTITVTGTDIDFDIDTGVGTITFSFASGSTEGYYTITFDIPVVGFDVYDNTTATNGLANQLTWHIRGGTIGPTPQIEEESGEEGVALFVGDAPSTMYNAKVGPITITK